MCYTRITSPQARAKGLPENTVVYGHALRNALLPLITILGLSIPGLIGDLLLPNLFLPSPAWANYSTMRC